MRVANVASTSQVRVPAMLLLLIVGNEEFLGYGGLQ